jgi:4-amino-4-deoxy-L-arabinose transferase-like glycosyltransferase
MQQSNERAANARSFLAVVIAALLIRFAFVVPVRPLPVSDFGWYFDRAKDIANGLGYTLHGHPTALWPPGWPYVLSGVVKVFGPSVLAGEITQAILNALTAGFAFLIARTLFGWASGVAAGIAYAVLPSAVEWSATLASEPLYTLLWTMSTYIWVSRSPHRIGSFALSGLLLGAAALVRPSALLFWAVLLAYVLVVRRERRNLRAWLPAVGAAAVCTVIVVMPTIIRNYHAFGTLVIVSNNGGVSLYQGNNAQSGGGYTPQTNPAIEKLMDNPRTEAIGDRLASRLAIDYMKAHPGRELILAIRKVKSLYEGDGDAIRFTLRSRHFREPISPPSSDRGAVALLAVNNTLYYVVMAFALVGIGLSFVRRSKSPGSSRWGLVLALVLYNTAIFAVIGGLDRYRYPTMPYFCVFAGYAVAATLASVRARTRARAAVLRTGGLSAQRDTLLHD